MTNLYNIKISHTYVLLDLKQMLGRKPQDILVNFQATQKKNNIEENSEKVFQYGNLCNLVPKPYNFISFNCH